jgi:hypothetical protein
MSGPSLQELMELGGWKSYEMVLRYAHLAPEQLHELNNLGKLWITLYDFPTMCQVEDDAALSL